MENQEEKKIVNLLEEDDFQFSERYRESDWILEQDEEEKIQRGNRIMSIVGSSFAAVCVGIAVVLGISTMSKKESPFGLDEQSDPSLPDPPKEK